MCARLGYTDDEIKAKRPEELYDVGSREALKAMFKRAFETGSADLEATQINRSGDKTPVEIRSQLIVVDNEDTILYTCRDITECKKQEEENINVQERLHRASTMEAIGLNGRRNCS